MPVMLPNNSLGTKNTTQGTKNRFKVCERIGRFWITYNKQDDSRLQHFLSNLVLNVRPTYTLYVCTDILLHS